MNVRRVLATTGAALMMASLGVTAAHADSTPENPAVTIVVDGQTLGAEEGLTQSVESFEIVPGSGDVGATYPSDGATQRTAWGASYATSQEVAYVSYVGRAKAAANVYSGLRIVRVCFWYTQGSRTSQHYCADATFSGGSWSASPEVTGSFNDSLGLNDPHSVFHIETSRIDPRG